MGWEKLKISSEVTMEANAGKEPEVFAAKTRAKGANTSGFQWANWGKGTQGQQIQGFPTASAQGIWRNTKLLQKSPANAGGEPEVFVGNESFGRKHFRFPVGKMGEGAPRAPNP